VARVQGAIADMRDHGGTIGYVRVAFTEEDWAAIPPGNSVFAQAARNRMMHHEDPSRQPTATTGSTSCPTAPRIPANRLAMSCWAGSSRSVPRSSTPRRCAGSCRRRLASVSTVPQMPAVEIGGLVKRYGQTTAVDGLTLSAALGAVTGILGPNGAGKTTTIEICEGYRKPDQGTVRVLGLNPVRDARALRPRVGVMLQSGGIPQSVPAADYLNLLSRFHAHPLAVPALLDLVGLTAAARTPYKRLSGGQQQRLSLAAAVIGRPELVFLDEPTAGMDPQARHATWDLIGQLRSAGVSIILTTHFMEEAERLCDYVAIIDHGQLVAAGTPGQLTGTVGQLRFRAEPGLDIESLLAALPPASLAKESPAGHYVIEVHGAVDPLLLAAVTAWCAERGVLANSLRIESRTLEDVFLELTGKELRS
jgi:ABC-2 type transport system ATP-binding protein